MKNLIFILFGILLIVSSSCKHDDDFYADSDKYYVLMKESFERPILYENDQNGLRAKRGEKIRKLKEYLASMDILGIPDDSLTVDAIVGFKATLTKEQIKKLKKGNIFNPSKVDKIILDFEIQGRPIMQGRRPIMQDGPLPPTDSVFYNPSLKTSYGISLLGGPKLGGSKNRIWILDTGVDGNHPDLATSLIITRSLARSFTGNNPLIDLSGHGTHCAGIAAALTQNSADIGMNGVAPGAPIISMQVLNGNGVGSWIDVLFALNHIAINKIPKDIVLMSLGNYKVEKCSKSNPALSVAIKNLARGNNGAFVVMSAGNCGDPINPCDIEDQANYNLPGCINGPNIFTVTAMDFNQTTLGDCASYAFLSKNTVDFIAPGTFVFSTFKGSSYIAMSGTSMSAALVAGIISSNNGAPVMDNSFRITCSDDNRYYLAKLRP